MSYYQNTTDEINKTYQLLLKEVQLYYTQVKTLNFTRLNIDITK